MMAVIAFAAIDCFAVRIAGSLAGCWMVGCAMQVGIIAMLPGGARSRRFWIGFEATGLGVLPVYIALSHAEFPLLNLWPYKILVSFYGFLRSLPPDSFQWCFEHGLIIDPHRPLKVYQIVFVFEVAYGLPMLLLAIAGGFLVSKLGSRRASHPVAASV